MSLSQIRTYINARVPSVDSDLSEWKGSLEEIGNIPKTLLESKYHITLGTDTSSTQSDRHIEDDFPVTITVFKRGFDDPVQARDDLLDIAHCIRLDLINPINVEAFKSANSGNIEDVQSVSITPSEIDVSNDNIIKAEVEFNFRLFFGVT